MEDEIRTEESLTEALRSEADEAAVEASEEAAGEKAREDAAAAREEALKKRFTLKYKIPLEEYYEFHQIMSREAVQKHKKRTTLLGALEAVIGAGLLAAMLVLKRDAGAFVYVLVVGMVLMGLYGAFYYDYIYPRSLRRVVARQHAATPYLQNEITVDFYPNKCTEYVRDKQADTPWHTITGVRENQNLILLMLGEKRCLLIPKSQLTERELQKLDRLLDEVCQNYEKKRVRI